MQVAIGIGAVLCVCVCTVADCEGDIFVRNDCDSATNVWYRNKRDSGWGQPIPLNVGEVKRLNIPAGLYRFRYLSSNRNYVYLYSRLEQDQTYAIGPKAAPCSGEPVDDRDTRPCEVKSLQVDGPEMARPDRPILLGVNVYLCDTGMHIKSVTPGTPAVHCFDRDTGEEIVLEGGDHIVYVNGDRPSSVTHFQELIRTSQRSIELKVMDRRTRKHRHLSTNLW